MRPLRKFDEKEMAALEALGQAHKDNPQMMQHLETLRGAVRSGWIDSKLPSFGNARAYAKHLETNANRGFHVHVDLSDFGQINKAHGDHVGDEALKDFERIAAPLKDQFGGKSFRPGGDEFKFHFNDSESAHNFVRTLKSRLDEENGKRQFGKPGVNIAGLPVPGYNLSATIGLGVTPEHAEGSLMKIKATLGAKVKEPHPVTGEMLETDKRLNYHPPGMAPTIYWSGVHGVGAGSPFAKTPAATKPPKEPVSPSEKTAPASEVTKSEKRLDKAEPPVVPTGPMDTTPEAHQMSDHPVLSKQQYGIVTADEPKFASVMSGGGDALKALMEKEGYKVEEAKGRYDKPRDGGTPPERSFIVHGADHTFMKKMGALFGQESVIWAKGGKNHLIYTNGPHVGKAHVGEGHEIHPVEPKDYYTEINYRGQPVWFTLNLDLNNKVPFQPHSQDTVQWVGSPVTAQ